MTATEFKRRVVGRRIVAVEMHAFRDGRTNSPRASKRAHEKLGLYDAPRDCGSITYNPTFILDDGSRLSFVVRETELGDYGIDPHLSSGP